MKPNVMIEPTVFQQEMKRNMATPSLAISIGRSPLRLGLLLIPLVLVLLRVFADGAIPRAVSCSKALRRVRAIRPLVLTRSFHNSHPSLFLKTLPAKRPLSMSSKRISRKRSYGLLPKSIARSIPN